jgi:hypothetical protein
MAVAEGPLSRLIIRSLKTSDDWLYLSGVFFKKLLRSHHRELNDICFDELCPGDCVLFMIGESQKGSFAVDVELV